MRLPRVPRLSPRAARVSDLIFQIAAWISIFAAMIRFFEIIGGTLVMCAVVADFVFGRLPVEEFDPCGKCAHYNTQHHGNCQECLRIQVRGDAATVPVPCSKFVRDPAAPRSRWARFMAARPQRSHAA